MIAILLVVTICAGPAGPCQTTVPMVWAGSVGHEHRLDRAECQQTADYINSEGDAAARCYEVLES